MCNSEYLPLEGDASLWSTGQLLKYVTVPGLKVLSWKRKTDQSHFCYNADLAFDQTEKLKDSKKLSEIVFINLKGIFFTSFFIPMRHETKGW